MQSPKETSQYFSLDLRRANHVITRRYLLTTWGEPGGNHGRSTAPASECLFRATVLDGTVIEVPFDFSKGVDLNRPSGPWAPGEDGSREISIETDQDLRKIQVLDATTKTVTYEEAFPDAGVKPTVTATLGPQNELRLTTPKKADRTNIGFSIDQGASWFPPHYRNEALRVVDAQGTWPIIVKQPDKPDQKVWVDVMLLFGGTRVHKQYEYDQQSGLTDVTGQGLWISPWPVCHNPAPYW